MSEATTSSAVDRSPPLQAALDEFGNDLVRRFDRPFTAKQVEAVWERLPEQYSQPDVERAIRAAGLGGFHGQGVRQERVDYIGQRIAAMEAEDD